MSEQRSSTPRTTPKRRKSRPQPVILGWREWVMFPGLRDANNEPPHGTAGEISVKAKVDTGARTSTLHAFGLERFLDGGTDMVRFAIHPQQRSSANSLTVELPVIDDRAVRNSSGSTQMRPVVHMPIQIGETALTIELTLTQRDEMGFRMLLGREALRKRFLVNPAKSFLTGKPVKSA